jgi:hypothetical protein
MRSQIAILVCLAAAVGLSATGCAASQDDAGAEPTAVATSVAPTATPTPSTPAPSAEPDTRGTSYANLEEMRLDLVAAGVACPTLLETDTNSNAGESAFCEDRQWLLSVFPGIDARNAVLQLNVDSLEPGVFLAGPNWLLGSADMESDTHAVLGALQPSLGGVVWDYTQPFPR